MKRSFEERALYSTGADLRIEGVLLNNRGDTRPLEDSYLALPAVSGVAAAFRGFGSDLSKLFGEPFTMFALDGEAIMDLAWVRDDFADKPLRPLVTSLSNPTPPIGMVLPEGAVTIGTTMKPDRPQAGVALLVRVKDSNGRYFNYFLGRLNSNRWRDLETELVRASASPNFPVLQPAPPLTMVAVTVHETNGGSKLRAGSVAFDSIFVRMADGSIQVVEPFDSVSDWSVLEAAPQSISDAFQLSGDGPDGRRGGTFAWAEGSPLTSRGIFSGPPIVPLPVSATESFLRINEHGIGETIEVSVQGQRVRVKLVDEVEYFPTLDTNNESYLIGDLEAISGYINLQATGADLRPNEIWLSTRGDGAERSRLLEMLNDDQPFASRVGHDRFEVLSNSKVDPLVDAGWKALLFVAFAAVFVLSGIGFLVHAYVSFKGREVQFALMRTIGFTMGQLMTLVFVEQVLVIGTGLVLGTWMGGRLGATVMPFLGHDDQGLQVLPPFVIQIDWGTLTLTYLAMGLLFAVIIAGVIWFVRRISLQRILRLGEM